MRCSLDVVELHGRRGGVDQHHAHATASTQSRVVVVPVHECMHMKRRTAFEKRTHITTPSKTEVYCEKVTLISLTDCLWQVIQISYEQVLQ